MDALAKFQSLHLLALFVTKTRFRVARRVLDTYADSTDGAGCRVSGTLDAFKGWTRLTGQVLLREMVLCAIDN